MHGGFGVKVGDLTVITSLIFNQKRFNIRKEFHVQTPEGGTMNEEDVALFFNDDKSPAAGNRRVRMVRQMLSASKTGRRLAKSIAERAGMRPPHRPKPKAVTDEAACVV
jgi:hypothetical protein